MRFLNPAGLLLLLGIPILIIIYLIKSRHEQKTVSSTYIWKLSERFAKKRLPIRRLRRILLFLLQLIMIVLAAMMASKPVMVKGESYDYVVILDGSASMQTVNEKGTTRFENAVRAVKKQAGKLSDGHTMTVILAKDTASLLIEGSDSPSEVKLALNNASCANGGCNTTEALELAQAACDRSDNAKVLFYTDCEYEQAGNITVVNMSKEEWNVSLTALDVSQMGEETVFCGSLVSYHKDAKVTVGLAIDGKTVDAKIVSCQKDVMTEVIFKRQKLTDFDRAEIYVEQDDGLKADNRFALCQTDRKKYDVLLASTAPLYLESALRAIGNCRVTVVSSLEDVTLSGRDLYIFDGLTPEEYPSDGSVVLFGTDHLPEGLSHGILHEDQGRVSISHDLESAFYDGLSLQDAVIKDYTGLLGNRNWTYLLYCGNVPVMASSVRENGARFAVFSFDLHSSNLPLLADYPILMDNLLEYCILSMIPKTDYVAGESVPFSLLPGTKEVYLQDPDGSVKTVYVSGEQGTLYPEEVGLYTLVMKDEQSGRYADFFVHIPEGEAAPRVEGAINIALEERPQGEKQEALSGIWVWFSLAFLLTLLFEWGWYYYEQY